MRGPLRAASTLERRVLDRPLAAVAHRQHARGVRARPGPDVDPQPRRCARPSARGSSGASRCCVLLNRRGFSTSVFCRQCGGTLECPNCSVSLVVHGRGQRASCHYCNHARRVPRTCPTCGGPYPRAGRASAPSASRRRSGRRFPTARVARLDRDTVRRRGAMADDARRVSATASIDVLVGTQMIAKGHDFPARDAGRRHLGRRRPRAGRLPRGRADVPAADAGGRPRRPRRRPGEAIIQTLYPGSLQHPARLPAGLPRRSSSGSSRSGGRCAIRRSSRSSTASCAGRRRSRRDGRRRRDLVAAHPRAPAARRGSRVLGPAPAPLARLRASTARSSS